MRFVDVYNRTRLRGESPCEEAHRGKYVVVDYYRRSPNHLSPPPAWYKRGRHHQNEYGVFTREVVRTGWVVTINSLEELELFVDKYHESILLDKTYTKELALTIYGDD